MREAERAWFLFAEEKSEALIRVAFGSLGQKQRVFEPYSLSLSSMVVAAISQIAFQFYKNDARPHFFKASLKRLIEKSIVGNIEER